MIEETAQALQDYMEQFHGVCLSASEWNAVAKTALSTAQAENDALRSRVIEKCAQVAEHYVFGPERDERDNARNSICQIIAQDIRALQVNHD